MFSKNDDIFKFAVDFKTDIYFQDLGKIKVHFIHALTENIDICVNVYNRQNLDKTTRSNYFNDAGTFFNTTSITTSISQITDEELLKFAQSMKNSLCEGGYSTLCKDSDPVKIMRQFTKYLYIPSRVSYPTIPESLQINFLKQFITTIIILMFNDQYLTKFSEIIPVLDVYEMCIKQFFMGTTRALNGIKQMSWKDIESFFNIPLKRDHKSCCYLYTLKRVYGTRSNEIINKFCPNYGRIKNINPKFNGVWLSPFDDDVAEQTRFINKIVN